jgi:hypothetical protein
MDLREKRVLRCVGYYLSAQSLGVLEKLVDGVEVLQVGMFEIVEERLLFLQSAVQRQGEDGQRGRDRTAVEPRALEERIPEFTCTAPTLVSVHLCAYGRMGTQNAVPKKAGWIQIGGGRL